MLELMLEQAKDDYREAASEHNEILMLFHIQQYALDIKKKKYDIQHIKKLLEENWKKINILFFSRRCLQSRWTPMCLPLISS